MISLKRISRAALGALTLGLCVAPSCTPLPIGETMVVLQTDLSLPKDVDRVTIQALVRGDQRHFNEFTKLGQSGQLQIPASIGLTLGDDTDPTTPVTFRVTAYQGTKARVLREVVTTIPKDRLVALKLPIQWLCWEGAEGLTLDADDHAISNCPENQTCIAGTCANNVVDPATLDTYAPEEVFGGGTGKNNDGTCFDTSACFTDSVDAPVEDTGTECFIKTTADKNVAIRSDSAGICGASGCFVPIDAKSDLGWQPGATDGTLKLPYAVCQRIKDKKASGVSISGACPLKTDGIPTCGPWSSAGASPPPPEKIGPVTLIGNQLQPISIAVAAGNVYWTIAGPYSAAEGVVKRIPISGGSATVIQAAQAYPRDIAVTTDPSTGKLANVLWANAGIDKDVMTPNGAAVIERSFATPATPMDVKLNFDLPIGQPEGVAAGADGIFFTDFGANAVYRVNTSGMTLLAGTANGTKQNLPYRIAVDKAKAYWTNEGHPGMNDGSVVICDFNDPLPIEIAAKQVFPQNFVLDIDESTSRAKAVFWANQGTAAMQEDVSQKVMTVSLDGNGAPAGMPVAVAAGSAPTGIALDKDFVYWSNQGDGTIMKLNRKDSSTHVVAVKQNVPGALVVDGEHIYWINKGDANKGIFGSIMMISKDAPEPKAE
jgi:hypothetical protein